jgi:nickel-dependent lactate racemase
MDAIPYGTTTIPLQCLPLDRFDVVMSSRFVSQESEKSIVEAALDRPVSGLSLGERLRPGIKLAIIIPDRTRVCGSDRFLPWILERVTGAGLTERDVTIIFAVGTHSLQSDDDRRRLVGDEVWSWWEVIDHNCWDEAGLVKVGTTPAGTDVYLNRRVVEADLVIACGAVVHHYFAGMGGGPKLIVPGVAGEWTIFKNHRRAITREGRFHPGCRDGQIKGNPIAEDIREAVKLAPPVFHLGLVLDDTGRIGMAFGGDLEESHDLACEQVRRIREIHLAEKRPVIVVSPGGHPRDIDFIQSHKSLQHASYVLSDSGVMILTGQCPEGLGSQSFLDWMKYPTARELSKRLKSRYTLHGQTALAHRTRLDRAKVICVSDMEPGLVKKLGMIAARSLPEAWETAQKFLPSQWRGYILPNGFSDIPVYNKAH